MSIDLLYGRMPSDCREWPFYPVPMPLNPQGHGPSSVEEATSIVWEVWDQVYVSYGSFDNLYDAINHAMKLTKEMPNGQEV